MSDNAMPDIKKRTGTFISTMRVELDIRVVTIWTRASYLLDILKGTSALNHLRNNRIRS